MTGRPPPPASADDVLRCPHRPGCPGCALAGTSYAAQLTRKRQRLVDALGRYPHLLVDGPAPAPVVPAVRTTAYRHRLKLPIGHQDGRVQIGLYDGRHRVLHTPDCPVLADPLRAALPEVLGWIEGLGRHRGSVHSVDLRVSGATGELYLVVACAGGELPGGPRAARALRRQLPNLAGVAVSAADPEGLRVMGRAPRTVAGAAFLTERIGATGYQLHPGAFFQVDPAQAEQLHALVREAVGDAAKVLDLYAGVGAYARMLAHGRGRVVAIEEVPQAAAGAAAGAPPNLEVITGKVEAHLAEVTRRGRFDAAVINPARRGSDPEALEALAAAVERVVYVSCGPETLARDLDVLAAFGLRVTSIVPVDLFPQTPEVETVVTLTRGPPLTRWRTPTGAARTPWGDRSGASGAPGRPARIVALVLGDPGPRGTLDGGRYERIGLAAGHALLRITLTSSMARALAALRGRGHPLAGLDPKTRAFFAEKAGLVRPFLHVEADREGNVAPLHGDLAEALAALEQAPARPARSRARRDQRRRR